MERGKYIILGGGDGSGKTHHADLLCKLFVDTNTSHLRVREPGSTPEGEKIRDILLDKKNSLDSLSEAYLFQAARALLFKKLIIPCLEKGINVVSDRSCYDSETYQGYAGGVDLSFIRLMNSMSMEDIKPDLAFIIDVDAKIGLDKETNPDRFAAKGTDYAKKVNNAYLEIAKFHSSRCIVIPYINNGMEEMQAQIRKHVKERLGIPKD